MDREIQAVLDKQKLERNEFVKKQKRELEEFKDYQKKDLDLKENAFEEERREIVKRNEPRRKAIKEICEKRENIEAILLKVLQR